MRSISINYDLKWQIRNNEKYRWSTCKKLFNVKTGRQIKKTLNNKILGFQTKRKVVKTTIGMVKEMDMLDIFIVMMDDEPGAPINNLFLTTFILTLGAGYVFNKMNSI